MPDRKEIIIQKCRECIDSGEPVMDYSFYYRVIELLKEQPKQKHGRWIDCDCGEWKCSACNDSWYLEVGDPEHNEMNYCPMCGAKMDGRR